MIDPADKQTQAIPLNEQPAKRKRGRPATGAAMTAAEKQRAYRERLKLRNGTVKSVPLELLDRVRATAAERIERLEHQLAAAIDRAEKAEKANKSNVAERPAKGLSYRNLTENAFDQIRTNEKCADAKTAHEWSFGVYLMWQRVAMTMNVQLAALEADEEKMRALAGLGPRDPK